MLPLYLLRRTLLPTITGLNFIRSASTMASPQPPSSFALDKSIFNPILYKSMRAFWFGDLPADATAPDFNAAQKWFGVGKSDEEKAAFDGACRQNFAHALESIGPERLSLPAWESYERDISDAEGIAAPFLPEVEAARAKDEKEGSDTLLSLILLLDQMSRNIYREPEGLRKVYTHYDRLALALVYANRSLIDHPFYRTRWVYNMWLLMPLLHSEHLPSHDLWSQLYAESKAVVEAMGEEGKPALEFLGKGLDAEEKHVELLKRFGRYPHRNEFVGRDTTVEEERYLEESGETFGVKRGGGKKEEGKSEL